MKTVEIPEGLTLEMWVQVTKLAKVTETEQIILWRFVEPELSIGAVAEARRARWTTIPPDMFPVALDYLEMLRHILNDMPQWGRLLYVQWTTAEHRAARREARRGGGGGKRPKELTDPDR